jgi:hypothetical protein
MSHTEKVLFAFVSLALVSSRDDEIPTPPQTKAPQAPQARRAHDHPLS